LTSEFLSDTEDGLTEPFVLAWWIIEPGGNNTKLHAAIANPKTPSWAVRWALFGHPQKGRPVTLESLRRYEAASMNPELPPDLVERILLLTQRGSPLEHVVYDVVEQITENLSRNPNLSPKRRSAFVREGAEAAGLLRCKDTEYGISGEMLEVRDSAKDVRRAASHFGLSIEDINILAQRWIQCHKAYQIVKEKFRLYAPQAKGHNVHIHYVKEQEDLRERDLGQGAALLTTHPQIGETTRQSIIDELNRGEEPSGVWRHALYNVLKVEEQARAMDYKLFESRVTGLRGKPRVPVLPLLEEASAWEMLLGEVAARAVEPNDDKIVGAAIERGPETAMIVANSPVLIGRLHWTPNLVRHCLLSTVKGVRLLGIEGIAATRSGEEHPVEASRESSEEKDFHVLRNVQKSVAHTVGQSEPETLETPRTSTDKTTPIVRI